MNILLTSVGRRSYLVKYFKKSLEKIGEVHVSNSSSESPAFLYADKCVTTPIIYDESYIEFLKNYCLENKIKAIISLFDIDLLVLSKNKKEFEEFGIKVIVSNQNFIEICNDKWKTNLFLNENNFNTPKTYLDLNKAILAIKNNEIEFPLILKPRWGMGSISVYEVENIEELGILYKKIEREICNSYLKYESKKTIGENVLIQEKLKAQEYGLDIINDLNGNYCTTIVKMKKSMRAGETDSAQIVNLKILKELGKELSLKSRHIGNLDLDLFFDGETANVLEMNARFGGGYPFSHLGGIDLPTAIIKWLRNEEVDYSKIFQEKYGTIGQKDIEIIKIGSDYKND